MIVLSDEEVKKVMANFLETHETHGEAAATEEDIQCVVKEVDEMKLCGLIAETIINGRLSVYLKDGQLQVGPAKNNADNFISI